MNAINQPQARSYDPIALLNAAIIESREGNSAAAQESMRAIAAQWMEWDEPWVRLGQSLRAAGEMAQAVAAYEAAISRNPYRAETLISLGVLRLQSGDADAAHESFLQAALHHPDNPEAWHGLGLVRLARGEARLAAEAFCQASNCAPDRLDYALREAEAWEACGDSAKVEAAALERLAANPLDGIAACLAGRAACKRGDLAEAETLLEMARLLLPEEPVPLATLANVHMLALRPERTLDLYREAQELAPDNFSLAHNHSVALYRLYRFAEAETILTAALERAGPIASALCTRANQRSALGDMAGAFADLDQAAQLDPTLVDPLRTRATLLCYHSGASGDTLRDAMVSLSKMPQRHQAAPHVNSPDPDRKLRIGLLSNTLRIHPVGWLTLPGFETLDRAAFSLHCFGRFEPNDWIAQRFARCAASWDGCEALADFDLAGRIRERDIDILIDLGGYGDSGRMTALIHKPAPVQIKWVGMQCATSGLAEMDWFITDRWETPQGFEPFYTERLLRLDDGYICYLPPPYAPVVAPLPASSNGFVTFGCFNNLTKFTDETLACWSAILQAVPNSRLVLRCPQLSEPSTLARLQARCTAAGMDLDRLDFLGRAPHRDFLASYNAIDIALDPFPYSGGLTTCEALYMGVPVITHAGEIFAARHSVSHLSNAGLADWVAADMPDYIARAIRFTNNLPALATLRAELRAQMLTSPLCDAPRFGRSLAKGLRHAWRSFCGTPD